MDDDESVDVNHLIKGAREQQFDIILRSPRSQVILAALAPGHISARQPATNRESDQMVYTIEGEGRVKIGFIDHQVHPGVLLLIPAGRPHQVTNTGATRLLYLDFFAPPAY
ncbi:MAG: cupin domain-containing protein [Actinomycetota bacterium]|nr:cupin domain-containing protein [Actinomycetota bacterium]